MNASAELSAELDKAIGHGQLLESAAKNIGALLAGAPSDLYLRVIDELLTAGEWEELNDRFYKTLEFGTGGLRGRTIGKIVTAAERGNAAREEGNPGGASRRFSTSLDRLYVAATNSLALRARRG